MATLNRRGKSWVLNWSDEAGQHRKTVGKVGVLSEKDARSILKAKELEQSTGARILNMVGFSRAVMFGQFTQEYLLWHQSEHPASFYRIEQLARQHLMPAFEFTPLDMITPQLAEQYKFDRQKTAAPATVGKEIRTLKAILNKAIEWGRIRMNPIHYVSEPKQLNSRPERFYTAEELQLIYQASPDRPHVWRLMANTGIRCGEALQLRWADVGSEEIRVVSTEEERTKSGKWRTVPLSKGAREALERFKHEGERVLPRIRPESLSRAFMHDAARASLDGSLHTLRHYAEFRTMPSVSGIAAGVARFASTCPA